MYKLFFIIGTILSGLSVGIGAFGAHALKTLLKANERTEIYETAVRYQFYHSLALLIIGFFILKVQDNKWFTYSGYCFITGVIIFSGSLYILSITNVGKWGAVTPIGGVFLIAGWIFCLLGVLKL